MRSWRVSFSISLVLTRVTTLVLAFLAISSAALLGMSPTEAWAWAIAASTSNHFWSLFSSSKMRLISALPYRPVSIGSVSIGRIGILGPQNEDRVIVSY